MSAIALERSCSSTQVQILPGVFRRHTRCFRRLHLLQASDTRVFCLADLDGVEVVAVGQVDAITGSMSHCPVPEGDLAFAIVMLICAQSDGLRQDLSRYQVPQKDEDPERHVKRGQHTVHCFTTLVLSTP